MVPHPGDSIPVNIEHFLVEDGVPEEGEVEWAVKRLRNNRAGGTSRMRAEDLKMSTLFDLKRSATSPIDVYIDDMED